MTYNEKLFESYNKVIETSYENFLKTSRKAKKTNIKPEEMEIMVDDVIEKWYDMPLKEINGISPREYINNLNENDVFEAFIQGAKLCDEMPVLIEHKLKIFQDTSVDKLIKVATDMDLIQNDDDFTISLTAIELLGRWKTEKAVEPLLELLFKLDADNELFMDHISVSLSGMSGVEKPIIEKIEALEPEGEVFNSLLYTLSLIGVNYKSDSIYRCLRNSFLRMEDKIFAAACLGDYGDWRAISLLRGFVEKNRKGITKEVYYALRHEVESLGGKMDDIIVDFVN